MTDVLEEILNVVQKGGDPGILTDAVNFFHHVPETYQTAPKTIERPIVYAEPESQVYLEILPGELEKWYEGL